MNKGDKLASAMAKELIKKSSILGGERMKSDEQKMNDGDIDFFSVETPSLKKSMNKADELFKKAEKKNNSNIEYGVCDGGECYDIMKQAYTEQAKETKQLESETDFLSCELSKAKSTLDGMRTKLEHKKESLDRLNETISYHELKSDFIFIESLLKEVKHEWKLSQSVCKICGVDNGSHISTKCKCSESMKADELSKEAKETKQQDDIIEGLTNVIEDSRKEISRLKEILSTKSIRHQDYYNKQIQVGIYLSNIRKLESTLDEKNKEIERLKVDRCMMTATIKDETLDGVRRKVKKAEALLQSFRIINSDYRMDDIIEIESLLKEIGEKK